MEASGPDSGRPQPTVFRLPFAIAGVCGFLFALSVAAAESRLTLSADGSAARRVHQLVGDQGFEIARAISQLGGPEVRTFLVAAVALALVQGRRWWSAGLLVVGTGGAAALDSIVKAVVARPRPHLFEGAVTPGSFSFPSGHAAGSMALSAIVIVLVWYFRGRGRALLVVGIAASLFTVFVGLSRVVVGAHYPTDVIGGYSLAGSWVALSWLLFAPRLSKEAAAARARAVAGRR